MEKPVVLSSTIIPIHPDNIWYQIRHDKLTWPNGEPGNYFVIQFPLSITIIAIRNKKILLVEQYRHTLGRTTIEFIAGKTEPNETPLEAAYREFEEEGGYLAGSMEPLGTVTVCNTAAKMIVHGFVAKNLKPTSQHLDSSEGNLTARWVSLKKWRKMIRCGEIEDCDTLAFWALYQEKMT